MRYQKAKQIFQTATHLTHFKDSKLNLFPDLYCLTLQTVKTLCSYKPDTEELEVCESTQ